MTWRSNDFSWKVNQLNFSRTDILGYELISTSLKESLSPWEIVVTSTWYCFAVSYGILSELLYQIAMNAERTIESHTSSSSSINSSWIEWRVRALFVEHRHRRCIEKKLSNFEVYAHSSIIFEHHFRTPRLLSARLKIILHHLGACSIKRSRIMTTFY